MKFAYLFVIPALMFNQIVLADSNMVHKWKFVQNNEIKNLSFKNENAAKSEESLRKIIGRGFISEFCSSENNLLKNHLNDMSKACNIKEKEITEDSMSAQMICEDTQEIKFRIRKQPQGHYEGISRVKIDNADFTLSGYSMIKIKNVGDCNEKEVEAMKKKRQ